MRFHILFQIFDYEFEKEWGSPLHVFELLGAAISGTVINFPFTVGFEVYV